MKNKARLLISLTVLFLSTGSAFAAKNRFSLEMPHPRAPEPIVAEEVPPPDPPQTHVFCAADLPCTTTANNTHTGIETFSNIDSVVVLNTVTIGTHWTDKLVTAYGLSQCASGCTIEIPDSVADDGHATTPVVPSNVTLRFTGSAAFTSCIITMGVYSKVYFIGDAILNLSGNNCTGFQWTTQNILQTNDHPIASNVRVNCGGYTGTIGILFGAASTKFVDYNPSITGCSAGIELLGGQFTSHHAPHLYNNTAGIKIYTVAGGGGNSNTFEDCTVNNNIVGVILNDNGGAALGMTANVFRNCNMLSNSVANYASNQLYIASSFTIDAGTTEVTGSTSTVTIDSFVINNASVYLPTLQTVNIENFYIADAVVTPWAILKNGAFLTITNSGGYGNGAGAIANTDGTSTVQYVGNFTNASSASLMTGSGTLIASAPLTAPVFNTSISVVSVNVSALPAAATGNRGQWRTVNNSTTVSSEGQTCVDNGGTTLYAAAFSNGSVWKCF